MTSRKTQKKTQFISPNVQNPLDLFLSTWPAANQDQNLPLTSLACRNEACQGQNQLGVPLNIHKTDASHNQIQGWKILSHHQVYFHPKTESQDGGDCPYAFAKNLALRPGYLDINPSTYPRPRMVAPSSESAPLVPLKYWLVL
jgi:hypothetical protein